LRSKRPAAGDDSLFAANLVALVGLAPPAPPAPLARVETTPPERTRDEMMAPFLDAELASRATVATEPVPIAGPPAFADLSLDDALDELSAVHEFIARVQPKLNAARKAVADLEGVVNMRLTERGARVYDGARLHCRYETRKSGSAGIPYPDALRAELEAINAAAIAANLPPVIPAKELDAALPRETPPPVVKPDLRKTRKLADRGDVVRAVVVRHILEPKKFDALVIEPLQINVTPSPPALT
jgi:hypothetical protein